MKIVFSKYNCCRKPFYNRQKLFTESSKIKTSDRKAKGRDMKANFHCKVKKDCCMEGSWLKDIYNCRIDAENQTKQKIVYNAGLCLFDVILFLNYCHTPGHKTK